MLTSKQKNAVLTGIAGVHHVVSELSLRGMIALPTIRNTPAYDVIVVSKDGRKHANIQVKTSSNPPQFWLMPVSGKIRSGPRDFYVFLARPRKEKGFVGYLVTGKATKQVVRAWEKDSSKLVKQRKRKAVAHSFWVSGENKTKAQRWASRWQTWKL